MYEQCLTLLARAACRAALLAVVAWVILSKTQKLVLKVGHGVLVKSAAKERRMRSVLSILNVEGERGTATGGERNQIRAIAPRV